MERSELRNSATFQEFPMNGNHHHTPPPPPPDAAFFAASNHYHQSDTSLHQQQQPNSTFWNVGNQLSATGFIPTAAGNHSNDFLAAGNNLNSNNNSNNLALMNGNSLHVSPSYPDALLESEFARLSLMPNVRAPPFMAAPPVYEGVNRNLSSNRNYSFNDTNGGVSFPPPPPPPQLRDMDIQRMRIQSAARGQQVGLYDNLDDLCMNGNYNGNFNGVSTYDMPNLYNSGRNLNLNGYQLMRNGFNSSSYDNLGLENSSRRNLGAYRLDGMETADWKNGLTAATRRRSSSLTSLKDLRGKIFSVATDQHGCRFLQSKFEEGKPEEIQMIFMEIKDNICDLMVDQFGNYLVQKFFAACNQDQMSQLLYTLIADERRFMDICVDAHGSRSMQKFLEYLTRAEQRCRVISVLRRITLPLTKSMNGHHVIQYCLKYYSVEEKKHILNVVADHCMEIATDKSGCCVLQQCVEHSTGEPRERLISEITSNALMLSEHPYGNYVVQYILGLGMAQATADIISQLSGNMVSLSMSKYGSNVVEKFLKDPQVTQDSLVMPIVEELITSPHFLRVLQDPFGNYVAQSAFAASKGSTRSAMISLIQANNPNLHSHPHGKRVLQCIKGSSKISIRP